MMHKEIWIKQNNYQFLYDNKRMFIFKHSFFYVVYSYFHNFSTPNFFGHRWFAKKNNPGKFFRINHVFRYLVNQYFVDNYSFFHAPKLMCRNFYNMHGLVIIFHPKISPSIISFFAKAICNFLLQHFHNPIFRFLLPLHFGSFWVLCPYYPVVTGNRFGEGNCQFRFNFGANVYVAHFSSRVFQHYG